MKPEDIRKLYAQEDAATEEEARQTQQEARTDPDQARRLLITLYSLAGEDTDFNNLLNLVVKAASMQLIALKAHEDDDFALKLAAMILDAMEQMKPAARVQRGKPKTARSA